MKAWIRKALSGRGVVSPQFRHDAPVAERQNASAPKKAAADHKTDGRGKRRPINPDGTMLCRTCRVAVPLTDFYVHRSGGKATGYYRQHYDSDCNPCRQAKAIARRAGLSIAEYRTVILDSGGLCQSCGRPARKPRIDHCRKSGKVRGILCPNCYQGIASFGARPDLLRKAAAYLERSGAHQAESRACDVG
jgi:Recombination endonuclease VII